MEASSKTWHGGPTSYPIAAFRRRYFLYTTGMLPLFISFAIGFLPCLVWLWFWVREDRPHHEPKKLLAAAFLVGCLTVAFVLPFQKYARELLTHLGPLVLFTGYSTIEEVCKYLAAQMTVLRDRAVAEPLDPVILMIIVGIGFAAIENTLFLLGPLLAGTSDFAIVTSNFRFVGATLVHILSSGIVGAAIALSWGAFWLKRLSYIALGVILASLVHSAFNAQLVTATSASDIIPAFVGIWIGVVVLLAVIEHIKHSRRKKLSTGLPVTYLTRP